MPHRRFRRARIEDALRILLAAGGPFSALILRYTEVEPNDLELMFQLALLVVPPLGAWVWGLYVNTLENKIAIVAEAAPEEARLALHQVPDETKVLIAKKVPGVATIVVKDDENGALRNLAKGAEHRDIVTETQNELDAKMSPKTPEELIKELSTGSDSRH